MNILSGKKPKRSIDQRSVKSYPRELAKSNEEEARAFVAPLEKVFKPIDPQMSDALLAQLEPPTNILKEVQSIVKGKVNRIRLWATISLLLLC